MTDRLRRKRAQRAGQALWHSSSAQLRVTSQAALLQEGERGRFLDPCSDIEEAVRRALTHVRQVTALWRRTTPGGWGLRVLAAVSALHQSVSRLVTLCAESGPAPRAAQQGAFVSWREVLSIIEASIHALEAIPAEPANWLVAGVRNWCWKWQLWCVLQVLMQETDKALTPHALWGEQMRRHEQNTVAHH